MNMLQSIIKIQYRDFPKNDFANLYELNIVVNHFDKTKDYYADYDFQAPYTLENFADFCLVNKIANWTFNSELAEDSKPLYDSIIGYFKEIEKRYLQKNLILFLKDFNYIVPKKYGYDLASVIYGLIPKFSQTLPVESFEIAFNQEPYLVFDKYGLYKSAFKKYPILHNVLFSNTHIDSFIESRLSSFAKIGASICNMDNFPIPSVQERIINAFDLLGETIISNKDEKDALHNQIKYKSVLLFFNLIKNARYNFFLENQKTVDNLSNSWLDKNGHTFSYSIPFDNIKNQFEDPRIPWYLKQLMLTHSKSAKRKTFEHYCVSAMETGKKSIADFCATNIPINDHFGMMTQQVIGLHHNLYCNVLSYYVKNQDKWNEYCAYTQIILQYIFKEAKIDYKQIATQVLKMGKVGNEYLFNKDLDKEMKQGIAVEFTGDNAKFVERLLRLVYSVEMKERNSYYNPDKLALGFLLNYNDESNPLREILSDKLMQYLRYCLIKDMDNNGREVGLNLRNITAHDSLEYEEFNYSNGYLSLLVLTGAINTLFLYYNTKSAERNK